MNSVSTETISLLSLLFGTQIIPWDFPILAFVISLLICENLRVGVGGGGAFWQYMKIWGGLCSLKITSMLVHEHLNNWIWEVEGMLFEYHIYVDTWKSEGGGGGGLPSYSHTYAYTWRSDGGGGGGAHWLIWYEIAITACHHSAVGHTQGLMTSTLLNQLICCETDRLRGPRA